MASALKEDRAPYWHRPALLRSDDEDEEEEEWYFQRRFSQARWMPPVFYEGRLRLRHLVRERSGSQAEMAGIWRRPQNKASHSPSWGGNKDN